MLALYVTNDFPCLCQDTPIVVPTIIGDLTFTNNKPGEGEQTVASCEWTGYPPPNVTWLKNDSILNEEELPGRINILQTMRDGNHFSQLQIASAEKGDTGDYTCNVSSIVGFDYQVVRLEVQGVCIINSHSLSTQLH